MAGIYINKSELVKVGRRKKVYCNSRDWYFIWNGKRVTSEQLLRLSYPIFFEDNGKVNYIGCYLPVSNCITILVEIDDNFETVQMYRQID